MIRRLTLFLVPSVFLAVNVAFAHHSHAMYDHDRTVTLTGTVKEFQWINPHCWIEVLVPDPKSPSAPPVEWGVEMGSPLELKRHNWKPGSLQTGDKITAVINPLKDGRPAGHMVSVTGADGKLIGTPLSEAEETSSK